MAPTYQRLLVPKRLKGITKFIDDGGYFPNSIIINFSLSSAEREITFDPIHKEKNSNAEFGLLNIPNAYGIAYIIDGQHRVIPSKKIFTPSLLWLLGVCLPKSN